MCVFARGYFDKVKKALDEIDRHQAFTRPVIEEIARQYEICPFEFSLDLALWVDCIICDYNYVSDPRVYLHRFFDFDTEAYIFLIDEAHNLPYRARSMYSSELDKRTVLDLQHTLKPHLPVLAKKLSAINTSQGSVGDGVVSDEEIDALFTRLSSGESSVFSRRMIMMRYRLSETRDAWSLFYGTPIRRQHCENYIRSLDRLLRSAAGCDPEGMIVDALHGNAQGRLYRAMCTLRDSPYGNAPNPT